MIRSAHAVPQFIAMATGISFFQVERLVMLAANDFLANPTLMMAVYLEWSAAMQSLSRSGQLSLSASTTVLEVNDPPFATSHYTHNAVALRCRSLFVQMAETVAQMPAACLDYFYAEYSKVDRDGEYAGYTMSGHLLANLYILDQSDPEHHHMPVMLTKPYAVIRLALKVCARLI